MSDLINVVPVQTAGAQSERKEAYVSGAAVFVYCVKLLSQLTESN